MVGIKTASTGPRRITLLAISKLQKQARSVGKEQYVWDTDVRGFGCRASPNGRLSWCFQYWKGGVGGKSERISFGAVSLDEARANAEKLRADVNNASAGNGAYPVTRKKQRLIDQKAELQSPPLSECLSIYLRKNSTGNRYWKETKQYLERLITLLGENTKARDITKNDIRRIIDSYEDIGQHGAARLHFAAIRPFFRFLVTRDIISVSPVDTLPAPRICAPRDRVLTDDEIRLVWQATDELSYPFGPWYKILLLTAQRRNEVAGMQWCEIDLENGLWIVPKERTKNHVLHTVHLSPLACEIIKSIRAIKNPQASKTRAKEPYVFSTNGDAPISGFSKAKTQLDRLLPDIPEWRIHDLRRTAASGMARLGFQPHVIERVLNHVSGATGGLIGVYQRFDYLSDRKKAVFAWNDYIQRIADTKTSKTNVLPFR
jgi:integrase